MIKVTPDISLKKDELHFTATKASGPGGQHVNATMSAVQLKFDAAASPAIEPAVMARLAVLAGQRMTNEGVIVIQVSDEKSQHRNRAIAQDRLVDLISKAATPPKPRRKTKPTKGSNERRLVGKARTGKLKKTRGRVKGDD